MLLISKKHPVLSGMLTGALVALVLRACALAANGIAAPVTPTILAGNLCSTAVLAFLCAGLAHFLDAAQGPGMIFRAWRAWLFRVLWFKGRARIYRQWLVDRAENGDGSHGRALESLAAPDFYNQRLAYQVPNVGVVNLWTSPSNWRRGLYKILGGCIYCSSVYTGTFFFVTGASFLGVPFALIAWTWPLFVGAQYAFIELIFAWSGPTK